MPSVPQSLQHALQHHQHGRLDDAERIYRAIIRSDPHQPDALHLLGVAQQQRGNASAAVDYIGRAVALNPQAAVFHANLAAAHKSLGELEAAKECLEQAVRLDPDFADGQYNLGTVLKDLNRPEEAAAALRRAIALQPAHTEAHNNLGVVLAGQRRWDEAIASYRAALQFAPEFADARNNLGLALAATGRGDEARNCLQRAVESTPAFVPARVNLGDRHRDGGDPGAAEREYRRALDVEPSNTTARNNLGLALKEQGRYDEALECFERVIRDEPEHVEARINRAFLHRLQGNLRQGWEDYDWRFRAAPLPRQFVRPAWDGQPLAGRTILIHAEMGVGDQIQFASCVPDVAAMAERCVLECDPRLAPLFARSFPSVPVVPESAETATIPHDVQIPNGSLGRFLRRDLASFPDRRSFLVPDAQQVSSWRGRYRELPAAFTVGISWRGGADAERQRQRSIPLERWQPLLETPGVNFVTLQYGDHEQELHAVERSTGVPIHRWADADALRDLDGFAARVAALDLVVSVDNSTVHFAGGLGVPCWVLLPFDPDWRWMLDRDDNPWYPSLRLFRQPERGNWDAVLQSVSQNLRELTGIRSSTAETDRDWLDRNATLRWDPAIRTKTRERGDFHLRRYEFAAEFCRGKKVLDVGCGTGYGSSLLAQAAESVHGIDACADAVDFATRKYGNDRLRFQRSFAEHTSFDSGSFDVVVGFEVLEHLISARTAMREFVRLLTADGVAIVSVPNNWGYTPHHFSNPDLPFLESLCGEFFADREYFFNNSGDRPSRTGAGIGPLAGTSIDEAECLIAVCRQPRPLPDSRDRVPELLDEIYAAAFARHTEFLALHRRTGDAWPTETTAMPNIPTVIAGRPLTLELDTVVSLSRVLLRLEADLLECTANRATLAIPGIALSAPRLAQLQLVSSDGEALASSVVRLEPPPSR